MTCQKCRREVAQHDLFECQECHASCCRSCLRPLTHVGQADYCLDCGSRIAAEEWIKSHRKPLATDCAPGDGVWWQTLGGVCHEGKLLSWDNGTAIVLCDGRETAVRAT